MLTYDEFKARDHFTQQDLLAFAYGRLIKDPPEGFAARLPMPPMMMVDRAVEISAKGARGKLNKATTAEEVAGSTQFIQENAPEQVAKVIIDLIRST